MLLNPCSPEPRTSAATSRQRKNTLFPLNPQSFSFHETKTGPSTRKANLLVGRLGWLSPAHRGRRKGLRHSRLLLLLHLLLALL